MRCLPVVILAVLLVAAEGKAVPDSDVENQQAPTQPLQLSDYINQAKSTIENWSNQIREQVQQANSNLPDHETFFNTIKEESTKLGSNIQEYLNNATQEIKAKNPELETLWTNFQTKVSEAMNNLNVNPETTEQVNQLRAKFQEGVQTIVTESEKASKTINESTIQAQENFSTFAKKMMDMAVQASQDLHNQLQQATTPAPQA